MEWQAIFIFNYCFHHGLWFTVYTPVDIHISQTTFAQKRGLSPTCKTWGAEARKHWRCDLLQLDVACHEKVGLTGRSTFRSDSWTPGGPTNNLTPPKTNMEALQITQLKRTNHLNHNFHFGVPCQFSRVHFFKQEMGSKGFKDVVGLICFVSLPAESIMICIVCIYM